jgi:light-regulated signal transduction histidine kinase (bacteriophytochrome)
VRAPKLGEDELGTLTDAFNQMLGRIEDQDRELRRHATDLEQRVEARTHELSERNETLRRNAAELLAANQELDAFAYSVSHDLRAPLRSIDGFSQILLEDYGAQLDEAGQDSLRRVRTASQRMATLIDDLLKLARVTRVEMRTERVDLSAMAQDIVAELQRADSAREVECTIATGLEARADAPLVRVVLENLLRNSWKYTAKQPRPRVEFGSTEANGGRAFMVRDNGAGFDMKYMDKLFGVFQRLHSAAEFEGTGVGLATVRRIITRHGGRIWAEGAVDQGATFYFTL